MMVCYSKVEPEVSGMWMMLPLPVSMTVEVDVQLECLGV